MRLSALILSALPLLAACGSSPGTCERLAEVACARWIACGLLDQRSEERCRADEVERCASGLCRAELLPVAGEVERCATALERRACEALVFRQPCPDLHCIAPDGDEAATTRYFGGYEPIELGPCGDGPLPQLGGLVAVRLLRDESAEEGVLVGCTQGLQSYFAAYDLWFYTDEGSRPIDLRAVIDAPVGELVYALEDAGVPTEAPLTEEQLDRAAEILAELLLRPLREFLDEHGRDGIGLVNVSLVPTIAGNEWAQQLFPGERVAGLGVSTALLARAGSDDERARLYSLLKLEGEVTPSVFLAADVLGVPWQRCDFAAARELGHALGLPSDTLPASLMNPDASESCFPLLSQLQADSLTSIRALAAVAPGARVVDPLDVWRAVRAQTPRLLERLRAERR